MMGSNYCYGCYQQNHKKRKYEEIIDKDQQTEAQIQISNKKFHLSN